MRLLHSKTLALHEFMENEIPPYAILSHTWETDEVSLQEMLSGDPSIARKKGYNKIYHCCKTALADGFEYAWVDTCCIDKTSSAELSEAINSMFQWYKKAEVCYAYIADYTLKRGEMVPDEQFTKSRWFTRGWTLQELIAPAHVLFFDRYWKEIGTKITLRNAIWETTGIHVEVLLEQDMSRYSVAQRMSWASNRQTTRTEDVAYSLMGIFGVNMPMLYGEGKAAFIRLQEAIMVQSIDHTLFAWQEGNRMGTGLLAESPKQFEGLTNIVRYINEQRKPFTVTNIGIRFHLPFIMNPGSRDAIAVLDCQDAEANNTRIGLRLTGDYSIDNTFHVSSSYRQVQVPISEVKKYPLREIYIDPHSFRYKLPQNEYEKILVDVNRVKNINLSGISEEFERGRDGKLVLRMKLPAMEFPVVALLFVNRRETHGYGCLILIQRQCFSRVAVEAAIVEVVPDQVSEFGQSINGSAIKRVVDDVSSLDFSSDRILWQHPHGKWWLRLEIKRKIISGEKVVHVKIEEDPDSS